jgi:hypothetical protein
VLVSSEDGACRAHGAVQIVSGDAVRDLDVVHAQTNLRCIETALSAHIEWGSSAVWRIFWKLKLTFGERLTPGAIGVWKASSYGRFDAYRTYSGPELAARVSLGAGLGMHSKRSAARPLVSE